MEFVGRITALRQEHHVFRRKRFFNGQNARGSDLADITWLRTDR